MVMSCHVILLQMEQRRKLGLVRFSLAMEGMRSSPYHHIDMIIASFISLSPCTDMSRLVQEATADYTEEDDEQGTAQTLRPSFPQSDV